MGANLKKPIVFETAIAIYTAESIVGEGGAGRIYKAKDDSGDVWAIKCLDPGKATKERVKRFKNELQFCYKNEHQNIVAVVDYGVSEHNSIRAPFYVMHLYSGSLRDLMKKGIGVDAVLKYFSQMLDGVEAAHLKKVIHRDLKPENILYDSDKDNLLIADFGIARFEEEELFTAVETDDSSRLANFQYAAPEQRQRGMNVDYRADIYALGLMLNEMYTGKVPYGTGYKTIVKVVPSYEYLDELVSAMIRQSIDEVKQQLIGRKNEFVTRQQLSKLKATVIPVTDIDDPLIADPPKLINFDWDNGVLTLFLHRPVNSMWVWALQNMGSYSSLLGKGPETFAIDGNKAIISAQDYQVQDIINYFKGWLPTVNQVYERRIRSDKAQAEEKLRKELERRIKEQEARQRVLKNIKI